MLLRTLVHFGSDLPNAMQFISWQHGLRNDLSRMMNEICEVHSELFLQLTAVNRSEVAEQHMEHNGGDGGDGSGMSTVWRRRQVSLNDKMPLARTYFTLWCKEERSESAGDAPDVKATLKALPARVSPVHSGSSAERVTVQQPRSHTSANGPGNAHEQQEPPTTRRTGSGRAAALAAANAAANADVDDS